MDNVIKFVLKIISILKKKKKKKGHMFEWFHICKKKEVHKQTGPTQIQLKIFNSNKVL